MATTDNAAAGVASPLPSASGSPGAWEPCGRCWGQRRILEPAPNGEGLVPRTCDACMGVGERPVPSDPVRYRPPARRR